MEKESKACIFRNGSSQLTLLRKNLFATGGSKPHGTLERVIDPPLEAG